MLLLNSFHGNRLSVLPPTTIIHQYSFSLLYFEINKNPLKSKIMKRMQLVHLLCSQNNKKKFPPMYTQCKQIPADTSPLCGDDRAASDACWVFM